MREDIEQQMQEYNKLLSRIDPSTTNEIRIVIEELDRFSDKIGDDRLVLLGLYSNYLSGNTGKLLRKIPIPVVCQKRSMRKIPGQAGYDNERLGTEYIKVLYSFWVGDAGYETLLSDIDSGSFEDTIKRLPDKILIQRCGIEEY